jgi:hypothetical protein
MGITFCDKDKREKEPAMQQYLDYIIPAAIVLAIVLVIFLAGFAYSRKVTAKYKNAAPPDQSEALFEQQLEQQDQGSVRIYEKADVNQQSSHPLGAVQEIIRARIRFVLFGLVLFGVALLGLYAIWIARMDMGDLTANQLYRLISTVLLAGMALFGLRVVSFATYRVKLRRTGFEVCSLWGAKSYEYKNSHFRLYQSIEHKTEGSGYRPVLMKTKTFNWVWICQVTFRDGKKPLELKSSRYAWLRNKMQPMIDSLVQIKSEANEE